MSGDCIGWTIDCSNQLFLVETRMPSPSRLRRLDSLTDMPLYRFSRLLSDAGGLVIRVCEGRFGITRREWRLISYLAPTDGMPPSELARCAGLDKARTSRIIGSLLDKQLIERTTRPSDRRHALVKLTDKGRSIHDEVLPLTRRINQELLSALSDDEVDCLDAWLDRLQAKASAMSQAFDPDLPRARRHLGGSRRVPG